MPVCLSQMASAEPEARFASSQGRPSKHGPPAGRWLHAQLHRVVPRVFRLLVSDVRRSIVSFGAPVDT